MQLKTHFKQKKKNRQWLPYGKKKTRDIYRRMEKLRFRTFRNRFQVGQQTNQKRFFLIGTHKKFREFKKPIKKQLINFLFFLNRFKKAIN